MKISGQIILMTALCALAGGKDIQENYAEIKEGRSSKFDLVPARTMDGPKEVKLDDGATLRGTLIAYASPMVTFEKPDGRVITFPAGLLHDDEFVARFPSTRLAVLLQLATLTSAVRENSVVNMEAASAISDAAKKMAEALQQAVDERDALKKSLESKVGASELTLIEDANRANIRAARAERRVRELEALLAKPTAGT